MPLPRNQQQIYINRKIDSDIKEIIDKQTPKVLFIHGQGGVGKSTLLKKFLSYNAKKIPIILIDMQDIKNTNFIDILLNRDITTVKNCKNFEKIRTIMIEEPKLFASALEAYDSEIAKQLNELDSENEKYGLIVRTLVDATKIIAKFFKRKYEADKKEILSNVEFALIKALRKDFQNHGLLMVDTLEKIKNININSKIEFENEDIYKSFVQKNYRLKDYIEKLSNILLKKSTIIIAGRNSQDELNMDIPTEYTEELSLENFSISNIKELFTIHVKRDKKLSMPSDKHIQQIAELTNGNPLIVGLFPKVAKEYDSWDELDYKEMERRIKTDDEFGLLFYMTDRVLSHLDESVDVWKLVIPRVLNQEVEKLLFKDEKILKELIEVGLASKGMGTDSDRYYLHDDVYRAIVAYYEREFKGGFSSWHDNENVKKLHKELIEFYKQHDNIYGVNSKFETCYHTMMLKEGFEEKFEVKREEFIYAFLSFISLPNLVKNFICKIYDNLTYKQQKELINFCLKMLNANLNFFGSTIYNELNSLSTLGKLSSFYIPDFSKSKDANKKSMNLWVSNIILLLKSLKKNNLEDDWSFQYFTGSYYFSEKMYKEVIESYEKAVIINPNKNEIYYELGVSYFYEKKYDKALKCYKKAIGKTSNDDEIYHDIGITYHHKQHYDSAIKYYRKSIHLNPNNSKTYSDLENAYYSVAVVSHRKEEYIKAIDFYEKSIEINPEKDEAYYYMGNVYFYLKKFNEAIKAYTQSLKINPNNSSAYTNLFELQLTQNQPFDQELEAKYIKLFQNQKETFIHYEMLKIFQAIASGKDANVQSWKQKYEGVSLGGWSFDELLEWIDGFDEGEVKVELQKSLVVFEGHRL